MDNAAGRWNHNIHYYRLILDAVPTGARSALDVGCGNGLLAVVGVARASRPKDMMLGLVGTVQHRWMARKYGFWEHSAPTVWPPPHDFLTVRRTAERTLPGVRWKQLLLWRYALIWRKSP